MPYLTLNGVTVRVSVEGASLAHVSVGGESERAPSGALEGSSLVDKREWNLSTTPAPASELDAWIGLIEGRGHSFPYNSDYYSIRGRGAFYIGGAALVSGGAKHGAGYLRTGLADDVLYRLALPSTWTVLLWRLESGTWRHYLVTSAGAKWKDGVRNDALATGDLFYVSSGDLHVGDILGATGIRDFDDVVALPYVVPDAWAPGMYTQHSGAAWSALPRVTAAGTFASSSVTVRGKVRDIRVIRCAPFGTLTSGHTIQFTLREV